MKNERFLSQEDAATLSRLAEHLLRLRDVNMNSAERLIDLIGTAILLPENVRRDDCVALYSTVTYREIGAEQRQSVVIVCPQDTQEALARVSILAPLAMSLLGRPAGSIVEVALPFDQVKFVEIVDVLPADRQAQEPHDGRAAATR
ncbi:MAG TPA: GreA/GreB family elongation factor [Noviherbaspirillum sp.]|nr:GreA/GreB family elongation factor [Noviherbaspirillum sp.]